MIEHLMAYQDESPQTILPSPKLIVYETDAPNAKKTNP